MAEFNVTAPDQSFTGETVGVVFSKGTATVSDDQRAALAYFRRRGYTVEQNEQNEEGQQNEEEFDPGEHSVAEVNEHLSGVDLKERERVLQAEAEGKSRLTVLNGPHSDLSGLE